MRIEMTRLYHQTYIFFFELLHLLLYRKGRCYAKSRTNHECQINMCCLQREYFTNHDSLWYLKIIACIRVMRSRNWCASQTFREPDEFCWALTEHRRVIFLCKNLFQLFLKIQNSVSLSLGFENYLTSSLTFLTNDSSIQPKHMVQLLFACPVSWWDI